MSFISPTKLASIFSLIEVGKKIIQSPMLQTIAMGAVSYFTLDQSFKNEEKGFRLNKFFNHETETNLFDRIVSHPAATFNDFMNSSIGELGHSLSELKDQPLEDTVKVAVSSLLFGSVFSLGLPRIIPGFDDRYFGNSNMQKFKEAVKTNPLRHFFLSVLMAGPIEEMIFRMIPATALTGDPKGGAEWGLGAMTSLAFGLLHVVGSPPEGKKRALPIGTSASGLFFWYLMREFGGGSAMLGHSLFNLTYFLRNIRR